MVDWLSAVVLFFRGSVVVALGMMCARSVAWLRGWNHERVLDIHIALVISRIRALKTISNIIMKKWMDEVVELFFKLIVPSTVNSRARIHQLVEFDQLGQALVGWHSIHMLACKGKHVTINQLIFAG